MDHFINEKAKVPPANKQKDVKLNSNPLSWVWGLRVPHLGLRVPDWLSLHLFFGFGEVLVRLRQVLVRLRQVLVQLRQALVWLRRVLAWLRWVLVWLKWILVLLRWILVWLFLPLVSIGFCFLLISYGWGSEELKGDVHLPFYINLGM